MTQALVGRSRSLTEEQVKEVLLARAGGSKREGATALARRLGVARSTIQQIWSGQCYGKLFPEIPRKVPYGNQSCVKCVHVKRVEVAGPPYADGRPRTVMRWRCSLGFPDIIEEGIRFAADCAAYQPSR